MRDESPLPLLLDAAGVATQLSIGTRTLWRWISTGDFPPPDVVIGAKVRRWRAATVMNWIDAQQAKNAADGRVNRCGV